MSDDDLDKTVQADAEAAHAHVGRLGRLRERAYSRRSTRIIWRVSITVAGVAIVVAGIAMLILPGPGWGAIILGVVLLATEYAWARRVLHPVKRGVSKAIELGRQPRVRVVLWIAAVLATSALIGLGIWYVWRFGWSWDGVRQITDSIKSWFGG